MHMGHQISTISEIVARWGGFSVPVSAWWDFIPKREPILAQKAKL